MTPNFWRSIALKITNHERKLVKVAAFLLVVAIAFFILAALSAEALKNIAGSLAFSALACSFGVMALGLVRKWFANPPFSFSVKPLNYIMLWYGSIFYFIFVILAVLFTFIGLAGAIYNIFKV